MTKRGNSITLDDLATELGTTPWDLGAFAGYTGHSGRTKVSDREATILRHAWSNTDSDGVYRKPCLCDDDDCDRHHI